jgi:hypothetical protein
MYKETYTHKDVIDGKVVETKVNYAIKTGETGNVVNVYSWSKEYKDYYNSVEKNSFIFEYFKNKFN